MSLEYEALLDNGTRELVVLKTIKVLVVNGFFGLRFFLIVFWINTNQG